MQVFSHGVLVLKNSKIEHHSEILPLGRPSSAKDSHMHGLPCGRGRGAADEARFRGVLASSIGSWLPLFWAFLGRVMKKRKQERQKKKKLEYTKKRYPLSRLARDQSFSGGRGR